ncbi:MAG TPA: crosslink repair DNA glycosylase YcaQ family protein, partial [Vicinamibacteria bacterium]|nr:crosslink repair DNA glycosylase YcaQ family protein [Vicinamibacteria bacterium]
RPRTERLFGFQYRNEIFTPPEKRRWGAYVLPFLLDEALVARVDAKADRVAGRLRVRAAFLEEGRVARRVAGPLLEELRLLAGWLGLDGLDVEGRDPLSRALRSAG